MTMRRARKNVCLRRDTWRKSGPRGHALVALAALMTGLPSLAAAGPSCPAGQSITGDTDGHCCWPAQAWKKSAARCVGVPRCPKGTSAAGETCIDPRARDAKAGNPESDTSCPTGMALIRGGSMVARGASSEVPTICMDRIEVTVKAMQDCVDDGACTATTTGGSCNGGSEFWRNHPANCVDWQQANKYCAWAGKRLPVETEWEWAARGRDRASVYPWGDVLPEDDDPRQTVCWRQVVCRRGGSSEEHVRTCVAGSHRGGVTPEGLEDMAGNVAEWTSSGSSASRVTRGGSYFGSAAHLQVSARQEVPADSRKSYIGFRCAMSVTAAPPDKRGTAKSKPPSRH